MNTSTEHILQCNQSEPQAGASGSRVDLINENVRIHAGASYYSEATSWQPCVRPDPG